MQHSEMVRKVTERLMPWTFQPGDKALMIKDRWVDEDGNTVWVAGWDPLVDLDQALVLAREWVDQDSAAARRQVMLRLPCYDGEGHRLLPQVILFQSGGAVSVVDMETEPLAVVYALAEALEIRQGE